MALRTCKNLDAISEYASDPLVLASILLAKDRRFLGTTTVSSTSITKMIADTTRTATEDSLFHFKFVFGDKVLRVFTVKDVVVSVLKENWEGQIIGSGSSALHDLIEAANKYAAVNVFVEEIPLTDIDPQLVNYVKACVENVEGVYITLWRKRGLYGFIIEELINDRGSYTYVFKARDGAGNVYALKVLKEDIAVNRNFMDLVRGYIHGFTVRTLDKEEVSDLIAIKGYDNAILKELTIYSNYISSIYALLIMKNKLDKDTYSLYPPAIVEEYADMGDLEDFVKKRGSLNLNESMYILIRVVGATALAHLANIVHMDIKPKNILLRQTSDKYGYVPMLTDFSGALGDPAHGYKFARLTPAYADPLALVRGTSDFSYDAYSLAMTLAYMLSSSIPKHRLILNIALLQNVYGYPIPMEKIEDGETMLKDFAKKVLDLALRLRGKAISYREFVNAVADDVEALDNMYMPWLSDIPKTLAEVIKKALTLKEEDRYRSCVEMWLDLRNSLIKENMEELIPKA